MAIRDFDSPRFPLRFRRLRSHAVLECGSQIANAAHSGHQKPTRVALTKLQAFLGFPMVDATPPAKPPLDHHPLLIAIGYVAVGWGQLEYSINNVIWAFAAIGPQDGACLTSQIPSIVPRMRALISLARLHGVPKALLTELNSLSAELDGLGRRRNRVIHDPWFMNEGLGAFGRFEATADRKLVFEIRQQSPDEVLDLSRAIAASARKFVAVRNKIKDEVAGPLKERLQWLAEESEKMRHGQTASDPNGAV